MFEYAIINFVASYTVLLDFQPAFTVLRPYFVHAWSLERPSNMSPMQVYAPSKNCRAYEHRIKNRVISSQ